MDVTPFDFNTPDLQEHDPAAPSPFAFDLGTPPNEWDLPRSPGFLAWYQKELSLGVSIIPAFRQTLRILLRLR